jgi:hypothetical protein
MSFNYDNVVQGLVDDLCLGDWSGGNIGQLVTCDDIVDHLNRPGFDAHLLLREGWYHAKQVNLPPNRDTPLLNIKETGRYGRHERVQEERDKGSKKV